MSPGSKSQKQPKGQKKAQSQRRQSKRSPKKDDAGSKQGKKRKRGQASEVPSAVEEAMVALPCPWGSTLLDLRNKKLTEEEKRWLANEFLSGRQTSKELHEKYSVPASSLWKYVQQVKLRRPLHTKGGRPRAIDTTSMSLLIEKLKGKPNMPDHELRPLIRIEYQKSRIRSHPDIEGENGRKKKRKRFKALNYVSVLRYCDELRKTVGAKSSGRSRSSTSAPASIPVVSGEPSSKRGRN